MEKSKETGEKCDCKLVSRPVMVPVTHRINKTSMLSAILRTFRENNWRVKFKKNSVILHNETEFLKRLVDNTVNH